MPICRKLKIDKRCIMLLHRETALGASSFRHLLLSPTSALFASALTSIFNIFCEKTIQSFTKTNISTAIVYNLDTKQEKNEALSLYVLHVFFTYVICRICFGETGGKLSFDTDFRTRLQRILPKA